MGSYQLRTMVQFQSDLAIDMIVVMPASMFQQKDYLNLRYFYLRSYYLAVIAAGLRKSFSSMDLTFDTLHGNDLLPILVARPKDTSKSGHKKGFSIRIIPCAPEGIFPSSKLMPLSNSLRQGVTGESNEVQTPTPFYNATLRAESQFSSYLRLLNSTSKSCAAFKDACILGRIWLQQRGFNGSISGGGFGAFEWAALLAGLMQGGGRKGAVLSTSLSSSQIFKATIQFLAISNLQKKPVVFGPAPENLDVIRQKGPMLYDTARELNILWKMTPWSANLLQQQAKWSLAGLKDDSLDQFDSLFIVKVDQPLQIFDLLVRVNIPSSGELFKSSDHRGPARDFSEKLYQILKKALGNRAQHITINMPNTPTWSISARPSSSVGKSVLVGIILDSAHATRKMDQGPSVEQKKEGAEFRKFWGEEKAELRRFQDGSILECVSFDASGGIPEQIIRYISRLHLNVQGDDLTFFGGGSFSTIAGVSHSNTQGYSAAKKALEDLERDIRDLKDLPLHIRQVTGISQQLRYASIHPPSPGSHPIQPMDIVISFEKSGKWTDNVAANQRLAVAFLLKIGSSLEESKAEIKTHLGIDKAERDTDNLAFLDIVYEAGFAFRLRVQTVPEILEKQAKNKQLERHAQIQAGQSLAICRRLYTNLPLHTQTISTFCTRLPPLSESIRVVKHWFDSHKLSCHFQDELLELLVLQAFLKPYPWQTPSSAMTGFLRTLELLARWEWHESPLIVDHSDTISASERSAIFARFNESRKADPRFNRLVLFVASSHDASGTAYTLQGPSRAVAIRMTKLARAACDLVKAKGVDLDPKSLFQSSLRPYDVVIRLSAKVLKGVLKDDGTKHSHFKNLDERNGKTALPLAEHPVEGLLGELNAMYSNALVFFHGGQNDNIIAGLWNPELERRTRKVDLPCSFKPVSDEEGFLEVDRQSILAEIARIGGDAIEKIEVKEDS